MPLLFVFTFLTTCGWLFFYLGADAFPPSGAAGPKVEAVAMAASDRPAAEDRSLRRHDGAAIRQSTRKPLLVQEGATAPPAAQRMPPADSGEKNLIVQRAPAAARESPQARGAGDNRPARLRPRTHRAALVARSTPAENALAGELTIRGAFISFDGPADWSIDDFDKIERFYQRRFGRPAPVSAMGQSETHDRLGLDHRDAVDIAVRPESPEGRALIAHLRRAGIPFIAFRGRLRGVSTGAHIHIGRPSPRLVEARQRATPARYDEPGRG